MTKLRRLDPQPADLTTHKGPFVTIWGDGARLICSDYKKPEYAAIFLSGGDDEDMHETTRSGNSTFHSKQIIFAAEEIREPIVKFIVHYKDGQLHSTSADESFAKQMATTIGGTVRRFVEDTSYGEGV